MGEGSVRQVLVALPQKYWSPKKGTTSEGLPAWPQPHVRASAHSRLTQGGVGLRGSLEATGSGASAAVVHHSAAAWEEPVVRGALDQQHVVRHLGHLQ